MRVLGRLAVAALSAVALTGVTAGESRAQVPGTVVSNGGAFSAYGGTGVGGIGMLPGAQSLRDWSFTLFVVCRGPVQSCSMPVLGYNRISGAYTTGTPYPATLPAGDAFAYVLTASVSGGPTLTSSSDGGPTPYIDSFFDIFVDVDLQDLGSGLWTVSGRVVGNLWDDQANAYAPDFYGQFGTGVQQEQTTTPEPVTIALLGSGLVGVGGGLWRRRKLQRDER